MDGDNKEELEGVGNLDGGGKEKILKFMDKEQGGFRKLRKSWYIVAGIFSYILVLSYLYGAGIQPFSDQYHRGIYVLITFVLVFLLFPFSRIADYKKPYPTSLIMNVAYLLLMFLWILNGFGVGVVEESDDLGYIVYYGVGVILFTYAGYVIRGLSTIAHKDKEDRGRRLVNYGLLGLVLGLSIYWLINFLMFLGNAESINAQTASQEIKIIGYSFSLGGARVFIGWALTLFGICVLLYLYLKPFVKRLQIDEAGDRPVLSDMVFLLGALCSIGYWIFVYIELTSRIGLESDFDFLISVIGVMISLEVTRRVLGWSLTLFGVVFLVYSYFGAYSFVPELLQHGGNSLKEVFVSVFINKHGTFGIMAYVLATYVILFIFFGAFLSKSGSTNFFVEFALSAAGKRVGGPAKVSVIASALFGSISGSAIANTVSTGIFTIPLMKRAGFRPHVAGAIEPSASIAGMFLPPIMGAGGFIMAEMTETAYSTIMLVAIFPAVMYVLGVFAMIHFEAKKYHLTGMEDRIESMKELLKRDGYLALPLIVITWLMLKAYSPGYAAFYGVITCILVSVVNKSIAKRKRVMLWTLAPITFKIALDILLFIIIEITGNAGLIKDIYRLDPVYIFLFSIGLFLVLGFSISGTRKWFFNLLKEIYYESGDAVLQGARQTLVIGATIGVIGIIVGVIYQTGIGLKFSQIILKSSSSLADAFAYPIANMFGLEIESILQVSKILFTVILIAFASLILGMGVPVTAAYVITVSLVAVALQELGVALIAAHMIVYWFSQDSNITPPVCIAAYAGAAIAGSNPWQTGWTSFKFAKMLYVMPILFAFVPEVLLTSAEGVYFDVSLWRVFVVFSSTILGTIAFAALTQGFLARKTKLWEFLLLIPVTILVYWPEIFSTLIGGALFAGLYFIQTRRPIDPIPTT